MRHQREVVSSARRRARPRSFTSLASCCIDSCVMTRPSPRAREARASSSVRRNSARCRSRSSHKASASSTASSSEWSRPLSIARRAKAFWSGVRCTSIALRIRKSGLCGKAKNDPASRETLSRRQDPNGQRRPCSFRNREHHNYKTAICFHFGGIDLSTPGWKRQHHREAGQPGVVVTHSEPGGLRFKKMTRCGCRPPILGMMIEDRWSHFVGFHTRSIMGTHLATRLRKSGGSGGRFLPPRS